MKHKFTPFGDFVPTLLIHEISFNQIEALFSIRHSCEMFILLQVGEGSNSTTYVITQCQELLDNISCNVAGGTCHQDGFVGVFCSLHKLKNNKCDRELYKSIIN
jgi:hypothetical protein